jgi:hypothetical protein
MNVRRGPEIKPGRVDQSGAEREFDHGFAVHHETVITFENVQLGSEVGCALLFFGDVFPCLPARALSLKIGANEK